MPARHFAQVSRIATGVLPSPGRITEAHVAGRLIIGFDGTTLPPRVAALAARGALAGVVLFARNIASAAQLRALVAEVVAAFAASPDAAPPLIAVDQEGGPVQRLKPPLIPEVAVVPPMREAAAVLDPTAMRALGTVMGDDLRAFGFNVDFAPVLDVDTNPANPIIGARAFGATPDAVIRHGLAFADGLAAAGVLACAKHFPGHGDTHLDSHTHSPRVTHDRARLDAIELAPFRAAVAHDIPMIMTAHVVYDALDPAAIATTSVPIVRGLLRDAWGYDGLVITDDLDMAAATAPFADAQALAAALDAADVDLALVCRDLDRAEALAAHLAPRPDTDRRLAAARARLSS